MNNSTFKLHDEVKNLRLELFLEHVCGHANIERVGRQMELKFEPEYIEKNKAQASTRRKCKYDRYFKGVTPSNKTVALIDDNLPLVGAYSLFYSPLWQVLTLVKNNETCFDAFYRTLPLDVLSLIYHQEPDQKLQWTRKNVTQVTIRKLVIMARLDALACLIALKFEKDTELLHDPVTCLDRAIFEALANSRQSHYLFDIGTKLYRYLTELFISHNCEDNRYWRQEVNYFELVIRFKSDILHKAINLRVVRYDYITGPFLYYADCCDVNLLLCELEDFKSSTISPYVADKGLVWLLQNIKRYYPRSEQFFIFPDN